MEQLFLTVEFQSINVKEMMEVKKKKNYSLANHRNACCWLESEIDTKITGQNYVKKLRYLHSLKVFPQHKTIINE